MSLIHTVRFFDGRHAVGFSASTEFAKDSPERKLLDDLFKDNLVPDKLREIYDGFILPGIAWLPNQIQLHTKGIVGWWAADGIFYPIGYHQEMGINYWWQVMCPCEVGRNGGRWQQFDIYVQARDTKEAEKLVEGLLPRYADLDDSPIARQVDDPYDPDRLGWIYFTDNQLDFTWWDANGSNKLDRADATLIKFSEFDALILKYKLPATKFMFCDDMKLTAKWCAKHGAA